jgi:hypothetical protein
VGVRHEPQEVVGALAVADQDLHLRPGLGQRRGRAEQIGVRRAEQLQVGTAGSVV